MMLGVAIGLPMVACRRVSGGAPPAPTTITVKTTDGTLYSAPLTAKTSDGTSYVITNAIKTSDGTSYTVS
jgi:hypothetical protein